MLHKYAALPDSVNPKERTFKTVTGDATITPLDNSNSATTVTVPHSSCSNPTIISVNVPEIRHINVKECQHVGSRFIHGNYAMCCPVVSLFWCCLEAD
jgi:hypothetical protein